eukprot:4706903-Pyramimonas_sp.AAC.2
MAGVSALRTLFRPLTRGTPPKLARGAQGKVLPRHIRCYEQTWNSISEEHGRHTDTNTDRRHLVHPDRPDVFRTS